MRIPVLEEIRDKPHLISLADETAINPWRGWKRDAAWIEIRKRAGTRDSWRAHLCLGELPLLSYSQMYATEIATLFGH